ncbi:MAG: hypothetical protein U1D36_07735 [Hydrogenophaga sp.]|uniref:hypothetical protein n=1 Tax=Comamonadaceae TaxID=80864 RepID=UPI00272F2C3D|nr:MULTISPECIES: hypothetical protein [Comamonadaceae]MDP2440195.1 hypothetical protein [Rhodoferax sp.]MDZ4174348.1 hypothetical protein [Hydrogenophaga sp.]
MYTLQHHEDAKIKLNSLSAKRENYTGNNPDKYRADIAAARTKLHEIEVSLKTSGLLPRTTKEERDHQLDLAFPNARSKEVVTWEGKKYKRCFVPVATSLSGKTVKAWSKSWEPLAKHE